MTDSVYQPLNKSIKQSMDPVSTKGLAPGRSSLNQDVMTESMLTIDEENYHKLLKKYKIFTGVSIFLFILGFFMFILFPTLIHNKIVSSAIDQAILSQDNEGFWASFPGDSNTTIVRNYSFFNLINDENVILHGEKPKFKEIENFTIIEQEDYIDIKYSEDKSTVTMKDWLHFIDHPDSRNLSEKIKIINVPSLGYWYTLKTSRQSLVFIEGFALLFVNIEDSLIETVIGQGISSQYLADFNTAFNNLLEPCGISSQNALFLWSDTTYGLSNKNNIKYWVQATSSSFTKENQGFSMDALNLKDYFTLSDEQLYYILSQFKKYIRSLENLIIYNHYCSEIQQCTGRQLAIRQMASSYVTMEIPPVGDVTPTDTICTDNSTCNGYYPQISSYYNKVYLKQHPEESPFLKFSVDTVRGWLDYNPTNQPLRYNKNENTLLHIGNLDALFNNGTLYDQAEPDSSQKVKYLGNIKDRFKLESDAHTRVFWGWVKYINSELLRQSSKGNERVGIASRFTSSFYQSFSFLQDNLQPFMLKQMMKSQLSSKSCNSFISISLGTDNQTLVEKICNKYMNDISSDTFIVPSIKVCRNKFQKEWKEFLAIGITQMQIEAFCDQQTVGSFGQVYHRSRIALNDFYQCNKTPNHYCSDFQLALKQWANSTVTTNYPQSFGNNFVKTTTFSNWNQEAKPFQYNHYTKKFPDMQFKNFTIDEAYELFNFDKYFSAPHIIGLFNDPSSSQSFKDYIRYIVIYIAFDGFTRERTAREFIFGYNDEYLLSRKNNYPPLGGDPSTPAYVAFNDLNITRDEVTLQLQWFTGKNDSTLVSQYNKINGLNYLTNNYTKFNGNQTYWVLQSPWSEKDYFYGTSAKQFAPDQANANNISLYIPNIQRYGSGSDQETFPYERYGYDLRIAYLGQSIYEASDINKRIYYQEFYAFFNETSVLGFPIFMSKHHFMNCSSNWTDRVQLYNEQMDIKYENTSHWDDSYVIIEPYSGVSFQSTIFLQANYYYQADELFKYNLSTMMPVFSIHRSGNLTEEEANTLFSPLKVGLSLKTVFFYIGLVIAIISLILTFYWCIKIHALKKKSNKKRTKQFDVSLQKRNIAKSQPLKSEKNDEEEEQQNHEQKIEEENLKVQVQNDS